MRLPFRASSVSGSALLLSALIVCSTTVALASFPHVPAEGEWPLGTAVASEVWATASESILFLGHGRTLQVLDISDPTDLQVIGEVAVDSVIRYATLSDDGNLIALSDAFQWVTLVDVSDRTSPNILARYEDVADGRIPRGMAFGPSGSDLLYVAMSPVGMYVLDVQDPSNPSLEGSYVAAGGNFYFDVAVLGDFAFLAEGSNGLTAVDISDPSNPVFSSNTMAAEPVQLTLDGTRCYSAGNGDGLRIIDLDVSGAVASFTPRGVLDLSSLPAGYGITRHVELTTSGKAIVADSEFFNGLLVIDVTNPDDPIYEDHYSQPMKLVFCFCPHRA